MAEQSSMPPTSVIEYADSAVVAQQARQLVAASLRALKGRHQVTDAQIGLAIGMSREAVRARMKGITECSAGDVALFARYFQVDPGLLFGGDAGLTKWYDAPQLTLIRADVEQLELAGMPARTLNRGEAEADSHLTVVPQPGDTRMGDAISTSPGDGRPDADHA